MFDLSFKSVRTTILVLLFSLIASPAFAGAPGTPGNTGPGGGGGGDGGPAPIWPLLAGAAIGWLISECADLDVISEEYGVTIDIDCACCGEEGAAGPGGGNSGTGTFWADVKKFQSKLYKAVSSDAVAVASVKTNRGQGTRYRISGSSETRDVTFARTKRGTIIDISGDIPEARLIYIQGPKDTLLQTPNSKYANLGSLVVLSEALSSLQGLSKNSRGKAAAAAPAGAAAQQSIDWIDICIGSSPSGNEGVYIGLCECSGWPLPGLHSCEFMSASPVSGGGTPGNGGILTPRKAEATPIRF